MNALHKVKRSAQILHKHYNKKETIFQESEEKMTEAQILQAQVMYNFLSRLANPLEACTNRELMNLRQIAQETRNGRYYKAINAEMNRRTREE